MKEKFGSTLLAAAVAVSLLIGSGVAFAGDIQRDVITPEWTSRPITITKVSASWIKEASKTLMPQSHGEIDVTRMSGASSSNPLQAAARNSSGNIQYPAQLTGAGQRVRFFRNTYGGNITFSPSLCSKNGGQINNIAGTWYYYEVA